MKPKYPICELPHWDSQWQQVIKDLAISFEAAAGEGTTYWDQQNRILFVLRCDSYRNYLILRAQNKQLPEFNVDKFRFNDTHADRLLTCTRGWYKDGAYMTSITFMGTKTLNHMNLPHGKIFPDQLDRLIKDNIASNEMHATVKATRELHKTCLIELWLKKQGMPVTDPFFGAFDQSWNDVQYTEISPKQQAIINAELTAKRIATDANSAYQATVEGMQRRAYTASLRRSDE